MKRKEFIRYLSSEGCLLKREGGSHSVYINTTDKKTSSVQLIMRLTITW